MANVTVTIQENNEVVTITANETTESVTISVAEVAETVIVTVQEGASGEDSTVTLVAGQNLSAGRVVIVENSEALYFDISNTGHAGRAYGITTTSGLTGENVTVKTAGMVQDSGFAFAENKKLWVGLNGQIYDTPQAGAVLQKAGIAIGSGAMQIDFSIQIIKN